ncbi:hypothetical protein JCM18750_41840 [Halostagnicola bangensis]
MLDYLVNPDVFQYDDGYVDVSEGPGLGIEINEQYVKQQAQRVVDWHNPVWCNDDGSVAEW